MYAHQCQEFPGIFFNYDLVNLPKLSNTKAVEVFSMKKGVQLSKEKFDLNTENIFVRDLIDAARKGKLEFEASERDIVRGVFAEDFVLGLFLRKWSVYFDLECLLDIKDAKELNAAMHLGADSPINMHLCELLVKRGARWEDFAYGAALAGNKGNAEVFLVKALQGKHRDDANIVYECVVFFAQKGGHTDIAEYFSRKIVKRAAAEEANQFFEVMQELIQQHDISSSNQPKQHVVPSMNDLVTANKDPNNPIIVSPKKILLFSGKNEGRSMESAKQTDQQVLQTSYETKARGIHKSNKGFNYIP